MQYLWSNNNTLKIIFDEPIAIPYFEETSQSEYDVFNCFMEQLKLLFNPTVSFNWIDVYEVEVHNFQKTSNISPLLNKIKKLCYQ